MELIYLVLVLMIIVNLHFEIYSHRQGSCLAGTAVIHEPKDGKIDAWFHMATCLSVLGQDTETQ